eukprot:tig00000551_g2032.t1
MKQLALAPGSVLQFTPLTWEELACYMEHRRLPPSADRAPPRMYFRIPRGACPLVEATLMRNGFRMLAPGERGSADLTWSGGGARSTQISALAPSAKWNHFPRSSELTRKDRLYTNFARMRELFGSRHFDFVPLTFILPHDAPLLAAEHSRLRFHEGARAIWICKPSNLSRGRGVFLAASPAEIRTDVACVVQRYIHRPLLVDGRKFDLRIYVAVTSFDPLRAYLYGEGLARFASEPFDLSNPSNPFVHLTNYSINKRRAASRASAGGACAEDPEAWLYGDVEPEPDAPEEGAEGGEGPAPPPHPEPADAERRPDAPPPIKTRLTALLRRLEAGGVDVQGPEGLMARIRALVVKTLLSGESAIHAACKMSVPFRGNCFELFGFDVLIDETLRPWLLEVNLSPSLACDAPVDLAVKGPMLADLFTLVGFRPPASVSAPPSPHRHRPAPPQAPPRSPQGGPQVGARRTVSAGGGTAGALSREQGLAALYSPFRGDGGLFRGDRALGRSEGAPYSPRVYPPPPGGSWRRSSGRCCGRRRTSSPAPAPGAASSPGPSQPAPPRPLPPALPAGAPRGAGRGVRGERSLPEGRDLLGLYERMFEGPRPSVALLALQYRHQQALAAPALAPGPRPHPFPGPAGDPAPRPPSIARPPSPIRSLPLPPRRPGPHGRLPSTPPPLRPASDFAARARALQESLRPSA